MCRQDKKSEELTSLLSYKDIYRSPAKVPFLTDLVLKETLIGILNVLRQVCKEYECGNLRSLQLGAILDLDILTLG